MAMRNPSRRNDMLSPRYNYPSYGYGSVFAQELRSAQRADIGDGGNNLEKSPARKLGASL